LKSRIDKDVSLATLRRDPAIGGAPPCGKLRAGSKLVLLGWAGACGKFQRTHRRGSHPHDSPTGIARTLDSLRRISRNFVPLAMQLVPLNDFLAHRLKSAEADVQSDLGRLDSTLPNALKNFRCEVQARRRRSDGAERFSVDRLIRLAVGGRIGAIDVRRQRNVADAIEHAEEIIHRIEAKMAFAEGSTPEDLGREFMRRFVGVAAEINPLAQSELAAGMNQRFPLRRIGSELPGQQRFDPATKEVFRGGILGRERLRARAAAMSEKARRQYLGVVKNQKIVGPQQLGKVAKHEVVEAVVTATEV